jgi:hypothetical protein
MLVLALILALVVVLLGGVCLLLFRPQRRYVESPAWQREHWEEEHEREKFTQRRLNDGI